MCPSCRAQAPPQPCPHWVQCTARGGWYHESCGKFKVPDVRERVWEVRGADDEYAEEDGVVEPSLHDQDHWGCRVCRQLPVMNLVVSVPKHFPPKGDPTSKYCAIWHDSANAMFAAIEYAWGKLDPEILTRLFQTKANLMRVIAEAKGANEYTLPHLRKEERGKRAYNFGIE